MFLTERSDFWSNDEKEKNAVSKNKNIRKAVSAKNRITSAVKQPTRAKSDPARAKQVSRAKSAPSKAKRQELKRELNKIV